MCGRKTLTWDMRSIIEELSIEEWEAPETYAPSYNISPSQHSPILRDIGSRSIKSMKWGLIPSWAKEASMGMRLINARSETLLEKPSFQHLVPSQRCIVLADGYYEWKLSGKQKIPYYIRSEEKKLLPMAGLWDRWNSPEGKSVFSYTVITTSSPNFVSHIHPRMPVILPYDHLDIWLQDRNYSIQDAMNILKPKEEELRIDPVSSLVNSVANNSPKCIEPIQPVETMDLFSK